MPTRFAVIGNPIAHSLSPIIHQLFAQQTQVSLVYEKILGDNLCFEKQVFDFFGQKGKGLNVTSPFKQRAFAMAKIHSERCKVAKSANTLWMQDNQIYADNTDGVGLIRDLSRYLALKNKKILVLGAGGAARGIIPALLQVNASRICITNRTVEKAEEIKREFEGMDCLSLQELSGPFDLVINATSASITGDAIEIPKTVFSHMPFGYDLAYNKNENTPFVNYFLQQGCQAVDGLGMLVEQAAEAFYIWNQAKPSTKEVFDCLGQV